MSINVTVVGSTGVNASIASSDGVFVSVGGTVISSGGVAPQLEAGANITITTTSGVYTFIGPNVPVQSVNGQTGTVVLNLANLTAAAASHTHVMSDITDLAYPVNVVNGQTGTVLLTSTDVSAASAVHSHVVSDITNLTSVANVVSVNGQTGVAVLNSTNVSAASAVHTHVMADVTDLAFPVSSINGITGTPSIVGGVGVTVSTSGSSITIEAAAGGTASGASLSDALPQALGSPTAGISGLASRSDHVHAMPSAADVGAAAASHTHTASEVTDLTSVANVVSVNGQTGVVALTAADLTAAAASHTHAASEVTDLTSVANVVSVNGQTGVVALSVTDISAASSTHAHEYVTALNSQTGSLSIIAGSNVTVTTSAGSITVDAAAGGGGDVDAGEYSGASYAGITISVQPQNQSVSVQASATWSATEQTTSQPTGNAISPQLISDGTTALFLNDAGVWSSQNAGASWSLSSRSWANFPQNSKALISGYGNGKWVVVDVHGKVSYTATSSPANSGSWTETTNNGFYYIPGGTLYHPNNGQRRIVFGNGLYLAASNPQESNWADGSGNIVGSFQYNRLQRSTDGVTWTAANPPSGSQGLVEAIAFDPTQSRFVMACLDNSQSASYVPQRTYRIYYSDDGIAWTESTVPAMSSGSNLFTTQRSVAAFGAGKFVIKPSYHISDVFVSSDGLTWTKHTGPGFVFNDMHYDGSFFVAIGDGAYATSTDGITWTNRAAAAGNWYSAALVGTKTITRDDNYTPNSTLVIDRTITTASAPATFTVIASSTAATPTFQWQASADGGSTWSNISGATSATLTVQATSADNQKRYRAVVSSNGVPSVNSGSALLTVN